MLINKAGPLEKFSFRLGLESSNILNGKKILMFFSDFTFFVFQKKIFMDFLVYFIFLKKLNKTQPENFCKFSYRHFLEKELIFFFTCESLSYKSTFFFQKFFLNNLKNTTNFVFAMIFSLRRSFFLLKLLPLFFLTRKKKIEGYFLSHNSALYFRVEENFSYNKIRNLIGRNYDLTQIFCSEIKMIAEKILSQKTKKFIFLRKKYCFFCFFTRLGSNGEKIQISKILVKILFFFFSFSFVRKLNCPNLKKNYFRFFFSKLIQRLHINPNWFPIVLFFFEKKNEKNLFLVSNLDSFFYYFLREKNYFEMKPKKTPNSRKKNLFTKLSFLNSILRLFRIKFPKNFSKRASYLFSCITESMGHNTKNKSYRFFFCNIIRQGKIVFPQKNFDNKKFKQKNNKEKLLLYSSYIFFKNRKNRLFIINLDKTHSINPLFKKAISSSKKRKDIKIHSKNILIYHKKFLEKKYIFFDFFLQKIPSFYFRKISDCVFFFIFHSNKKKILDIFSNLIQFRFYISFRFTKTLLQNCYKEFIIKIKIWLLNVSDIEKKEGFLAFFFSNIGSLSLTKCFSYSHGTKTLRCNDWKFLSKKNVKSPSEKKKKKKLKKKLSGQHIFVQFFNFFAIYVKNSTQNCYGNKKVISKKFFKIYFFFIYGKKRYLTTYLKNKLEMNTNIFFSDTKPFKNLKKKNFSSNFIIKNEQKCCHVKRMKKHVACWSIVGKYNEVKSFKNKNLSDSLVTDFFFFRNSSTGKKFFSFCIEATFIPALILKFRDLILRFSFFLEKFGLIFNFYSNSKKIFKFQKGWLLTITQNTRLDSSVNWKIFQKKENKNHHLSLILEKQFFNLILIEEHDYVTVWVIDNNKKKRIFKRYGPIKTLFSAPKRTYLVAKIKRKKVIKFFNKTILKLNADSLIFQKKRNEIIPKNLYRYLEFSPRLCIVMFVFRQISFCSDLLAFFFLLRNLKCFIDSDWVFISSRSDPAFKKSVKIIENECQKILHLVKNANVQEKILKNVFLFFMKNKKITPNRPQASYFSLNLEKKIDRTLSFILLHSIPIFYVKKKFISALNIADNTFTKKKFYKISQKITTSFQKFIKIKLFIQRVLF